MSVEEFDCIVVGGGPAGSSAATFIAMQGHRVLLLEREKFPRHQIGESLLPSTVHGICVMLGVSEQLKNANFTKKRGGSFRWGKSPIPWTFSFGSLPSLGEGTGWAYQVERSKFDQILLENARSKGVVVRERCAVDGAIEENGRIEGLHYTDETGASHTVRARFTIDATGNTSSLSGRVGQRVYSKFFQNVALYGYFENGKRLPPPNDGNILCAAFKRGWFWYIPLSPTLTSVGAVVAKDEAELLKHGHDEALSAFIAECPIISEYLAGARRSTEGDYAPLRIRKDYSYCGSRFWIPGLATIGDAAAFIDPVFSSGVHLATYAALNVARSINTCLRGGLDEEVAFSEFERRYRREFGNFYQFLVAFYDMNNDEDSYFWQARKVLNTEESANEAFVRLVAGVSSGEEKTFASAEDFFRSREGLGDIFEGVATGTGSAKDDSEREGVGFDAGVFLRGFTEEIAQLQAQAMLGSKRATEQPLFSEGLIPTQDGFHWRAPRKRA